MLFTKSVATKAYLLSQRAFSTTNPSNFSYLIKSLPKTVPKLPHPGHVKSVNLWRNLFIVAGIPALLLINYNIEFLEDHHPPRPEFHPYEYMRKRTKVIFFVLLEYSLGSISLSILFISFFSKLTRDFRGAMATTRYFIIRITTLCQTAMRSTRAKVARDTATKQHYY